MHAVILYSLGFLCCLLGLPLLILFIGTAVPLWISLGLSAMYLASFAAIFFGLPVVLGIGLMLAASFGAICLSQRFAQTPPILDTSGKALEGSIASLEPVRLNGSQQWISIRGKNRQNPVLLWLAGGPGNSDLAGTRAELQALEDDFIVVGWEQAGAVKSYKARELDSLNPEIYIADAVALIEMLRERFGQEKIYLLGHSWGSLLGIWLVQRYPAYFHAYISVGTYVNARLNDELNFQFALELLREQGKSQKIASLEKQGIPPYTDSQALVKYANYMSEIANFTKSKLRDESKDVYTRLTLHSLLAPEYGIIDKINIYRSAFNTFRIVMATILDVELVKDVPCLDIPVTFAQGRWDMNCVTSLAEDYFEKLKAPSKRLIIFEHSGHLPHYEEKEAFLAMMKAQRFG